MERLFAATIDFRSVKELNIIILPFTNLLIWREKRYREKDMVLMDIGLTVQGDKTAKWFILAARSSLLLQKSSYSNASTSFFNAISCGVGVVYSKNSLSTLP